MLYEVITRAVHRHVHREVALPAVDLGAARCAVRLVQLVGYRNARASDGQHWARLAEA